MESSDRQQEQASDAASDAPDGPMDTDAVDEPAQPIALPILGDRQRATVGVAVTVVSVIVILCAVAALLALIGAFFSRFSGVFLPVAVAGIVALILNPYFDWFVARGLPKPAALVAVFLIILLPLAGLGWFLGDLVVEQASDLISKIPEWWKEGVVKLKESSPKIQEVMHKYGVEEKLRSALEGQEGAVLQALRFVGGKALSAGSGFFGALGSLFGWAVLPVYVAFFLLIDLKGQRRVWSDAALPFLKKDTRDDISYLVNEFVEIIVAFFRGQFVIALMQGILFAIGFEIVGLSYGLIIGLLLGFLNIIPYLGSIVGLGVALPLALFQQDGGWPTLVGVLVVFTIVQTIEGYVLTPRIMGERTGLHPMVIMIAIFFWGSALSGITGMILAIPLTAFFVVFWRLLNEKYIQELV
ncbi:MAG: AI-2E family transporter [bacterium]|nr:AI-2E family transporter [bacterium]